MQQGCYREMGLRGERIIPALWAFIRSLQEVGQRWRWVADAEELMALRTAIEAGARAFRVYCQLVEADGSLVEERSFVLDEFTDLVALMPHRTLHGVWVLVLGCDELRLVIEPRTSPMLLESLATTVMALAPSAESPIIERIRPSTPVPIELFEGLFRAQASRTHFTGGTDNSVN